MQEAPKVCCVESLSVSRHPRGDPFWTVECVCSVTNSNSNPGLLKSNSNSRFSPNLSNVSSSSYNDKLSFYIYKYFSLSQGKESTHFIYAAFCFTYMSDLRFPSPLFMCNIIFSLSFLVDMERRSVS